MDQPARFNFEMSSTLHFDEPTHTYSLNGRKVVSVTQVIRSHVQGWQASEWHQARGTAVHAAVKLALEDKLDWDSVDERIRNRVKAILKFIDDAKLTPLLLEHRMAAETWQFAGCLDLLAMEKDCSRVIVDYKSTLEPVVELQLAAYDLLLSLTNHGRAKKACAVQCKDDGTYKAKWFSQAELRNAANVFLAFLTTHGWKERHGLNAEVTESRA